MKQESAPLLAGLAKIEITPPAGQPMGGFGERFQDDNGASHGIRDPLFARVMVLKTPDMSAAIVVLDLLFFSSAKVVAEAKRTWGLDHVILSSTHTHSGPVPKTGGMTTWTDLNRNPAETLDFGAFSDDPWYASTERKVLAAIGEAMGKLFPARVGAAGGSLEDASLAHNRRKVEADGKVAMLWANPERVPTGPVDHTLGVIRVDDATGRPRAVLVNFGCHAVVLGSKNRLISADFPGAMAARIEEKLGPDGMAMFLQGAEGDVDPCDCGLSGENAFRTVQETGGAIANAALRVAETIGSPNATGATLRAKRSRLSIPHRREAKVSDVVVTTLLLGRNIALVTVPGEAFTGLQAALRERSPVKNTFFLGLAYSGEGIPFTIYLPTKQAATEGGYGADNTTFLEIGAGERIVNEAIASITSLVSQLEE